MFGIPSEGLALARQAERVLEQARIDESGPGTILHDFDALLAYIRQRALRVTAKGQLPLATLLEINARLAHPIEIRLQRPQQKSFPHIHGLYLLVRASGLTSIGTTAGKPQLVVDEQILQSWSGLNPTERYGNLLETWLLRGRPEIIGERGPRFARVPEHFLESLRLLANIPDDGLQVAGNRDVEHTIMSHSPGAYNVGLLDLFGIVGVQRGAPEPGQGWRIERITRTPFGTALFALLRARFFGDRENIYDLEEKDEIPFGVFQPILQPCFPEWRNNLTVPRWAFREGAHVFKVTLGRVSRRIAIPAEAPLGVLASTILDTVDFDEDHLYEFIYQGRSGAEEHIHHPAMDEGPHTGDVRVGDLPLGIGQAMTFVYDFGDWWTFGVTLERVDPAMRIRKPQILEAHGKAPAQYPSWDEEDEEEDEEEDGAAPTAL